MLANNIVWGTNDTGFDSWIAMLVVTVRIVLPRRLPAYLGKYRNGSHHLVGTQVAVLESMPAEPRRVGANPSVAVPDRN